MGQTEKEPPSQREERPPEQVQETREGPLSECELVDKAIEQIEDDLTKKKLKVSVGDLVRLLQLRKELQEEQPREIKVSWVKPHEEGHAGEK